MANPKPNFDQMKKEDLVEFLRGYSAKTTGKKAELLHLAKKYYETKGPATKKEDNFDFRKVVSQRKIFSDKSLIWRDINELPKNLIKKELEDETINSFLTNYSFFFGDDLIDCSTQKPSVKGKHLYFSRKVHQCQFAEGESLLLFRCTMSASMKTEFR